MRLDRNLGERRVAVRTNVNIGCGMTPTPGWKNFDNSPSLRLAAYPKLAGVLHRLGLINARQMDYIRFCQQTSISWADATSRIPVPDGTADIVYTSHVVGYFDHRQVRYFFSEARRALKKGGKIRLALPSSEENITLADHDEGRFTPAKEGWRTHLRRHWVGSGSHKWVYGSALISTLLTESGFDEVTLVPAGETTLSDPGALNLREREGYSVYLEATAV